MEGEIIRSVQNRGGGAADARGGHLFDLGYLGVVEYYLLFFLFLNLLPPFSPFFTSVVVACKAGWIVGALLLLFNRGAVGATWVSIFLYLIVLKNLVTPSMIHYASDGIRLSMQYVVFPVLLDYLWMCRKRINLEKLYFLFAAIVVVSGIPFLLGAPTYGEGYDIEGLFGAQGKAFTGVFPNFQASIFIAYSVIPLMWLFYNRKGMVLRCALLVLVAIGMYQIYKTYFRTGLTAALIGLAIVQIDFKKPIAMFMRFLIVIVTIGAFVGYLYQTDPAFKLRIQGQNQYTVESGDKNVQSMGSGRTLFWETNLKRWLNDFNPIEKLIGSGQTNNKNAMQKAVNLRIFSHNGFIDSLVDNGVIGIGLHLSFLFAYWRVILQRIREPVMLLHLANISVVCLVTFVQSFGITIADVFTALSIATCINVNMEPSVSGSLILGAARFPELKVK